ncbi:MAG: hypothetical protein KKH98_00070 [Spirochaetes bacterium]|nr:hypothetical protein [Spirochaetota bacterium]
MNVSIKNNMVTNILNLTEELNIKAEEKTALDPLSEITFKTTITPFNRDQEEERTQVEFLIIYLSGGGMESSYVINESVSFFIDADRITGIIFRYEAKEEKEDDMDLTDETAFQLLEKIRIFCERVLS